MANDAIEEFAQNLVQKVRDAAIQSSDRELKSNAHSPVANRWREVMRHKDAESIVRTVIPDIVDDTLFYLLQAIDEGLLSMQFTTSSGKCLDLTREGLGEMAGWYMGRNGWRAKYSGERSADDFSDPE